MRLDLGGVAQPSPPHTARFGLIKHAAVTFCLFALSSLACAQPPLYWVPFWVVPATPPTPLPFPTPFWLWVRLPAAQQSHPEPNAVVSRPPGVEAVEPPMVPPVQVPAPAAIEAVLPPMAVEAVLPPMVPPVQVPSPAPAAIPDTVPVAATMATPSAVPTVEPRKETTRPPVPLVPAKLLPKRIKAAAKPGRTGKAAVPEVGSAHPPRKLCFKEGKLDVCR